jgi:membrane-bound lytic murein transglycosylase F
MELLRLNELSVQKNKFMKKIPTVQFSEIKTNRKVQIGLVVVFVLLVLGINSLIRIKKNHIHDLPSIMESGRLAVLTDSSRLGFSRKGDSIYGFQYEIVKAFADTMGLELVITEENDLEKCVNNLKLGDYDIIANAIPITTQWKNEVQFTTPLFTSRQVLVQRILTDSVQKIKIKNHLDLANDTVYLPIHSPYKMRIENLSNEIAAPIQIIEVNGKSAEQMVHLVSSGKIKYTICEEQIAQKLKLQYPNIDVSIPIGFEQDQAWVVHKESKKLLEELNSFLEDFIGSSEYWKIYRKYYN